MSSYPQNIIDNAMKTITTLALMFALAAAMAACAVAKKGQQEVRRPVDFIQDQPSAGAFEIAAHGRSATIFLDSLELPGVIRAANDLGDDVRKVTGTPSTVVLSEPHATGAILVGTIGESRIIDRLIAEKKIDVSAVAGRWESYLIQTVDGNLVIAGSDRRGTIFGIYDISENIGVSPWYWWADVPSRQRESLYVKAGVYVQEPPKVKYRGIFINDENPSFGDWCNIRFGGVNSKMYVHMFELILRLRANYLWPAMWGKSFTEDDPMSPVLAHEYGIIMGTSHHEPMMRAHADYTRHRQQIGPWDYTANREGLDRFFREGIERNRDFDKLITIGMRGDGDVALGENDEESMRVLGEVIAGQRGIIREVFDRDPGEVPQTWAIFTEVQRYYDAGFTVPDDVLLMFCDNNWGYIRRIGPQGERDRQGGMGLYYHIDMNGGPWNDRWINTTTIPKLREQFNLAYRTGLDDLWVVNVGDLKPKELPIDFIMRYAWDPEAVPADRTMDYTVEWAERIFGPEHAAEIADLVSRYPKYNLWRKPEVQAIDIFSFVNHREAERVLGLWRELTLRAEALLPKIATEARDAYYQLVLYPVKASAGVAEIYLAAGWNNLYARQGRVSANDHATRARELFEEDKRLSDYYMSEEMADGKWAGMMQDVHIGYTQWSMPRANALPALQEVVPLPTPTMGVAVEGDEAAWPGSTGQAQLPRFDALQKQRYYIDVFNRGTGAFEFEAFADRPWIELSAERGEVQKEYRLEVEIDWKTVPPGRAEGTVIVSHAGTSVPVRIEAIQAALPQSEAAYFGGYGEFSIPSHLYTANVPGKEATWITLPDLGRGEVAMGIDPVTAPSAKAEDAPVLEYTVYLPEAGKTTICLGILPTQDVYPERGLRIALGLDDGRPAVLDARKGLVDTFNEYTPENIARSHVLSALPRPNRDLSLTPRHPRRNEVFDDMRWLDAQVEVDTPGLHTLKVYMVDPEIVLETIIVNPDNRHPSYFGAPAISR
jgi:hypothetical protein